MKRRATTKSYNDIKFNILQTNMWAYRREA